MDGDEIRELSKCLVAIPNEMYWAIEVVRRSGAYNMAGIIMQAVEPNYREMIDCIKEAYIKFVIHTCPNLEEDPRPQLTLNHLKFAVQNYGMLQKYYPPVPEGVINLKVESVRRVTF